MNIDHFKANSGMHVNILIINKYMRILKISQFSDGNINFATNALIVR